MSLVFTFIVAESFVTYLRKRPFLLVLLFSISKFPDLSDNMTQSGVEPDPLITPFNKIDSLNAGLDAVTAWPCDAPTELAYSR